MKAIVKNKVRYLSFLLSVGIASVVYQAYGKQNKTSQISRVSDVTCGCGACKYCRNGCDCANWQGGLVDMAPVSTIETGATVRTGKGDLILKMMMNVLAGMSFPIIMIQILLSIACCDLTKSFDYKALLAHQGNMRFL